jgi:hypothetical protein
VLQCGSGAEEGRGSERLRRARSAHHRAGQRRDHRGTLSITKLLGSHPVSLRGAPRSWIPTSGGRPTERGGPDVKGSPGSSIIRRLSHHSMWRSVWKRLMGVFDREGTWEAESRRVARLQGFAYLPTALPHDDPLGLFQLPLSLSSGDCLAEDILAGKWQGVYFVQFQLTYPPVQSGAGAGAASWSCAAIQAPADLPRVTIRKTRLRERARLLILRGGGNPERRRFDRALRADSEDPEFLAQLLSADVFRAWILGPEAEDLTFEIENCWLMCLAPAVHPHERSRLVWALKRLLEHMPQQLLDNHRARPEPLLRYSITSLHRARADRLSSRG